MTLRGALELVRDQTTEGFRAAIERPFYIRRYEVTQAEYNLFLNNYSRLDPKAGPPPVIPADVVAPESSTPSSNGLPRPPRQPRNNGEPTR